MSTIADTALVELRQALEAITAVRLKVREELVALDTMNEGDCCMTPVSMKIAPATAELQRFTMMVVLAFRTKLESKQQTRSAYNLVHEYLYEIYKAIKADPRLRDGGTQAKVERTVRSAAAYWYKPGGNASPAGAIIDVELIWTE